MSRSIPDILRNIASLMLEVVEHPDADRLLNEGDVSVPFTRSLDEEAHEYFAYADSLAKIEAAAIDPTE